MNPLPTAKSLGLAVLVAVASLGAAGALGAGLQHRAARTSHRQAEAEHWFELAPPAPPALVAHGRELFLDSCAHCHGADASGDEGPDLHGVPVSDRYLARIITQGIPHEMPSFAKKLGADDINALTAYVRSLE